MLARPKITTASGARNYFEQDTYYINNEFEQGSFYGKLKDELGLEDFNLEDFDSILQAKNPKTGEQLLNLSKKDLDEKGERKRAALDLTFAADKSVSILYEIASDEDKAKIRDAFNKSIDVSLDFVESNYANSKSRDKIAGNNTAQNKLLFTRFDHSESRDNDMHLHQHCLMTNLIQDENGKYKSIEFNQTMLNHQLIGQIQRNEFAKNLQELGIETEILDVKVGSFKARSVSQELREEFSQRSKAIKEEMEKSGQTSYQATHTAQKQTAKWKDKNKNRLQIQEDNIKRLENSGADIEQLQQTTDDLKIRNMTAKEAVEIAIEDITDKKSVFKKEDIYKHALKVALTTNLSIADIINEFENKEELIIINEEKNQFTTLEVLEKEEFIFSLKDEKNFTITADTEIVENAISEYEKEKGFDLKKGQRELVHTILESESQIVIAQGVAGAGKSTSLKIVKTIAELEKRKIVALAPTGTAANNLAIEAGIKESYTVAKFLQTNGNDIKDSIVIVDEAGMMGLRDTHDLLKIAKENNLKIVFSGDKNQKKSISQGDIFPAMQRNDFSTVYLDEGNRQKTDKMRNAVKNILDKDIVKALDILKDTTQEITNSEDRLLAAQKEYLKDRHSSLLITTTNNDRQQLNKSIRDVLIANDEITNSKTFDTRETPSLSDLEKRSALHYKVDQKVFLSKNIGSISAGREATIIEVNQDTNTIVIEHSNKNNTFVETVDLSISGNSLNQFLETKKEFGIGDQIITKKNDKKIGMTNGKIGTITAIKDNDITVMFDNKEVTFSTNDYKYLDHAYAITDFASQGKTTDKVIAVANSQAASFNDFYTQITRAKFEAHIITDDLEELQKRAANESTKLNATELIAKYKKEKEQIAPMSFNLYRVNLEKYTDKMINLSLKKTNVSLKTELSREESSNDKTVEQMYIKLEAIEYEKKLRTRDKRDLKVNEQEYLSMLDKLNINEVGEEQESNSRMIKILKEDIEYLKVSKFKEDDVEIKKVEQQLKDVYKKESLVLSEFNHRKNKLLEKHKNTNFKKLSQEEMKINNEKKEEKEMTQEQYTESLTVLDTQQLQQQKDEILELISMEQKDKESKKLKTLNEKVKYIEKELERRELSQKQEIEKDKNKLNIKDMVPLHDAIKNDTVHLNGKLFSFKDRLEHNLFLIEKDNIEYKYNRLTRELEVKQEEIQKDNDLDIVEKSALAKVLQNYEKVSDIMDVIDIDKKSLLDELEKVEKEDLKNTFQTLDETFKNIDSESAKDIMVATYKAIKDVVVNEEITLSRVAQSIITAVKEKTMNIEIERER